MISSVSNSSMSSSGLVLTGLGMASCLGNAITACAAARAGIIRAAPLELVVGTPDQETPQSVTGHPCPWVEGFTGVGRLLALLSLALEDLLAQALLPKGLVSLLLDVPPLGERPGLQEQLLEWFDDENEADFAQYLRQGLSRLTTTSGREWDVRILQGGHAGVGGALQMAQELLSSGQREFCIVGGVDSYMDLSTLEWLYGIQRLKHANRSVGLMPGEGAGVLLVEREGSARKRGARVLAKVGSLSLRDEEYWLSDEGQTPHGRALTAVIRDVIHANPRWDADINLIIHDLNGQEVRAREWGFALVQLASEFKVLAQAQQWSPALSFGDVGSASGAFALCMAVRAFARGYSRGPDILLCNSSEQGLRSAVLLKTPAKT